MGKRMMMAKVATAVSEHPNDPARLKTKERNHLINVLQLRIKMLD